MIYLDKYLEPDLLAEITELCLLQMEIQEGLTRDNFLPASAHTSFQSTLQLHKGRAIIWYNDKIGSTKSASIEFDIPIVETI